MTSKFFILTTFFLSIFFISCDNTQWEPPDETEVKIEKNLSIELENKYRDIFINSTKSVVQINLYSRDVFGIPDNKIGTGSGFLWDDEGNILTNYHVIQPAITSNPMIFLLH